MLFASAARAAAPTISDDAKLFSNRAVSEANGSLERIYQHTAPHKQVAIQTLSSLPAGRQADNLAEERFAAQDLDGVLLLIVKDPHKLAVTVGRGTAQRFHDAEAVRGVMLDRFRHGDYDGGLLAGVRLLESRLTNEFAVGARSTERTAPFAQREERSAPSSGGWWWILILGGGGLLAWFLWRLRKRSAESMSYGPPMGDDGRVYGASSAGPGPGYATTGGGGGWGRTILGGAAGALAGNWLYDRLFHRDHDNDAWAGGNDHDSHVDAPPSDHGDVGGTFGGHGAGADWSDSGGGSDFGDGGGGGGGGDW